MRFIALLTSTGSVSLQAVSLAGTWTSAVQTGDAAGDCGTSQQPWPLAEGFHWMRSYMAKAAQVLLCASITLRSGACSC